MFYFAGPNFCKVDPQYIVLTEGVMVFSSANKFYFPLSLQHIYMEVQLADFFLFFLNFIII